MIMREIHFFILSGRLGRNCGFSAHSEREHTRYDSMARANFKASLRIENLAHMAPSTFNRYFRQVTGLNLLQFQKRLRLHEAKCLMLAENHDATSAALAVGYENASQFTREYKRLFGAPPRQDMERRRAR